MTRFLLVRHGQSEWNAVGRWQGWADPALTSLGALQSRLAADAVGAGGTVDVIVASDLRRAVSTATIMAESLGIGPVAVDPLLRERDVGDWTGLTRAEIEQRWPEALSAPVPEPPGGESAIEVVGRTLTALYGLAEAHPESVVLVVTHGGVIRGLERHLGRDPAPLPNLGGVWLELGAGGLEAGSRLLLIDPDDVAVTVPRQL